MIRSRVFVIVLVQEVGHRRPRREYRNRVRQGRGLTYARQPRASSYLDRAVPSGLEQTAGRVLASVVGGEISV